MNIRCLFFVVISAVVLGCTTDYKPIFNGENLDGWQIHGAGKWYVEDGELVCESGMGEENGYLSTLKDYHDFEMQFEFFPVMLKNSCGVFFRTKIEGFKADGWKVEIAATEHGTGSIYEQNGRGWLKQISEQDEKVLKMGQWNRMKIKVVGGNVLTWLNGELMATFSDDKISKGEGVVAFQIHKGGGVKMRWRKIEIKELDKLEKVNHYF